MLSSSTHSSSTVSSSQILSFDKIFPVICAFIESFFAIFLRRTFFGYG
jgi:hypothetical protein